MASRYFVSTPQSETEEISVSRLDDHSFEVTCRGHRHVVDVSAAAGLGLSLLIDGHSYQADVDEAGVRLNGQLHPLTLLDERTYRRQATSAATSATGKQLIRSPMPGKVVKLLVAVGDEVKEGQGLVVVEAMKMENELKSPKAGTVLEVKVQEGVAVEGNAHLISVE